MGKKIEEQRTRNDLNQQFFTKKEEGETNTIHSSGDKSCTRYLLFLFPFLLVLTRKKNREKEEKEKEKNLFNGSLQWDCS